MKILVTLFAFSVAFAVAHAIAELYNRLNAKSVRDNLKRLGNYLGIGPIP